MLCPSDPSELLTDERRVLGEVVTVRLGDSSDYLPQKQRECFDYTALRQGVLDRLLRGGRPQRIRKDPSSPCIPRPVTTTGLHAAPLRRSDAASDRKDPSAPRTTWSRTRMPTSSPTAKSRAVNAMSSADGVGSPLG